ncbi:MAG: hypothetical protein QXV01_04435 [Candidatus Bathyarchaeia archaeon]
MPRLEYTNLSIKKDLAKKLELYAGKQNMSSASLVSLIVERLDLNVPLDNILLMLDNIQSIRLDTLLKSEVLKVKCAQLYFYVNAMSSIVASLLKPSSIINIWPVLIVQKFWEKKNDNFTVLSHANLIDKTFSTTEIVGLIRNMETLKNSLTKILDSLWPRWRDEVSEPLLLKEIVLPDEYYELGRIINHDTLKEELKPYFNDVAKIWKEANELIYFVGNRYPELLELTDKCMKEFSKLFLLPPIKVKSLGTPPQVSLEDK